MKVAEQAKAGIRRVLAENLDQERAEAEADRRVLQRRIQRLKDERQKLLDGYYAGAIPVDLLKSEQERIGRGTADTEKALRKLSVKFDRVEEIITRAMAWVDSLHLAYLAADEQVRRLLNQSIFKRVFIGPDGVVRVEYTDGIVDLVVEDGQELVEQVGEASADKVVAVGEADEGHRNEIRPGRRTRAYHRMSADHGWNVKRLVEVSGLEPPTSTLRT